MSKRSNKNRASNKNACSKKTTQNNEISSYVNLEKGIKKTPNTTDIVKNKSLKYIKHLATSIIFIATLGGLYQPLKDFLTGEISGEIVLSIGNISLQKNIENNIFFSIPNRYNHSYKFIIPTDYTVLNESNAKRENINISIRYDKKYNRALIPNDVFINKSYRMNSDISREFSSSDDFYYSKFRLNQLSSHDIFTFSEGAFAYQTNIPIMTKIPFESGLTIKSTVFTEDAKDNRTTWKLHYQGINVNNKEQMLAWIYNFYGKSVAIQIRKQSGFISYLYKILFGDDMKIFAFYPEFTERDGNIYVPINSPSKPDAIIIHPYSWDLLFN